MKLNTGKIPFHIEFDNGDKDCIYFNPNDPDLALRLKALGERLKESVGEVSESEEDLERIQSKLKEELNVVFGSDISSVVFKHCSPLAVVGGEFFAVQFFNAITPEIKKQIEKSQKEIEKHIGKYRK